MALHTLWLASLAARAVTPATFSFQAAWTVVDLVWVLVSSVSIGSVIQNRKLNDFAAEWQSIVMVPAEGHRTTGVFVSEFTEEEVSLSLAEEMPIWRKWPASVSDLFRFPHPANEVQNRMHAGITTFVHLPVCLLLMYLLNSPWYILVPLLSTALRVTFGYRFDIQAWVVVLMSRLFDPLWVPGPPKRYVPVFYYIVSCFPLRDPLFFLDLPHSYRSVCWGFHLDLQLRATMRSHRGCWRLIWFLVRTKCLDYVLDVVFFL